ncbi:GNAT family N-acetyltransferase [Mucilaginibacter sp. dw_454]|uniref:GNAT family N-acetyltransferase n=1 Tax=Mucilaginibacter sp. dw_454 TaxID=2720079 RepID=UPI001BD3CAD9|nr:GNAT family N-acetyltransferase [Mucilaginibacter sp. dw_454]
MPLTLRAIEAGDNHNLAAIIRASLEEFNVPKQGTVYSDPTTDALFELFSASPGSCYFIAEEDGVLLGGCGVYPTDGLPTGYAELVKLYLTAESRGKGIGKILMDKCFEAAADLGYTHLYLESFPQLSKAVSLYHKAGFESLDHALGNSGHFACTIWMTKELKSQK